MELKEIKSIIDLMTRNDLTEFELEKDNVKIRIKRGPEGLQISGAAGRDVVQAIAPAALPPGAPSLPMQAQHAAPAPETGFKEIKSPMVGTFYRSPSPEAPPYIEIGQSVTEDTVVCIIEAMKVMNEIKSEVRGVITEILSENAKPVEFGKPLFKVRAS